MNQDMERVLDDHEFTIEIPNSRGPHCCRLQIFAAAGQRPVIVATQDMPPATGRSLTNAAELFAAAAWRRHLEDSPEPPRWIQHYTSGPAAWMEVTFDLEPRGRLSARGWLGIDLTQLERLVGQPIDPARGDRYVPPLPDPPTPATFRLLQVDTLPPTEPFRTAGCMPSTQTPFVNASCCTYHAGDWTDVMAIVEAALAGASELALFEDDKLDLITRIRSVSTEGSWAQEAAMSLLYDPLCLNSVGWVNGQHRAQAAIDAGVRRLLVETCEGYSPRPAPR